MRNERLSNNKKVSIKKKTRRHFDKSIPLGFFKFFSISIAGYNKVSVSFLKSHLFRKKKFIKVF